MPGALYATFILSSIVLIAVGIPMGMGKIKQNNWYGVRLPITYKSVAAWDAANIQYGWWLVAGGLMSALVLLVGWVSAAPPGGLIAVYVIVMVIPLLGGIVPSVIAAYKAQARVEKLEQEQAGAGEEPQADEDRDELPSQFR